MTTQAWLIFPAAIMPDILAANNDETAIIPRIVDNPLANNLGYGPLQTDSAGVAPARILNDPDYERFWDLCSALVIAVMDSDTLFLPWPD